MTQPMVEHNKVFDQADREFKARPDTTRAVVDANVCRAENDPDEAADLVRVTEKVAAPASAPSPADRISEIQSRRHQALTEDHGDPARPSKVDVIDDLGGSATPSLSLCKYPIELSGL